MADFDNGLPPQGTDMSGSEISSVLIDKTDVGEGVANSISAVLLDKEEVQEGEVWSVSNILIDKQDAEYRNRNMFL
ncbi:hypothetical protein [Dysgonomonas reticulitermitis]